MAQTAQTTVSVQQDRLLPERPAEPTGSREFELMLLCARLTRDTAAQTRLRALLQQPIDWDFLITRSHYQRVLPLVSRTLARIEPDAVPESATRRLHVAAHANARRNLILTSELLQVMDLLRAHGIASIPYKGPVLAARVYSDIALRQFADLDLIIRASDVVATRELLLSRGYTDEYPMTEEALKVLISDNEKHIGLLKQDFGIDLEIHWGISTTADPIQIPTELAWDDLEVCSLAGRSIQAPPCETLLLIQCIHGAKHRWEKLGWICDVAEIVRSHPDLDWARVLDRATRMNGRRIVLLGLMLARDLLGAAPPADVDAAIESDAGLVPLAAEVRGRLSALDMQMPDPAGEVSFFIRLREHSTDKFRVAFRQARRFSRINTRDRESMAALPTLLLYVLRPVRLAREYGAAPFRRLFKGVFQWKCWI
jgi:hypothetical protein